MSLTVPDAATLPVDPAQLEARVLATRAVLAQAVDRHANAVSDASATLAMASSLGAEDMVLTDLVFRNALPIEIFTLDTGRLHEPTLRVLARIRETYGRSVRVYFPEAGDVEALVEKQGINGFYESVDARKACCRVRKVLPLKRALAGRAAWITGLRREQSPTRADLSAEAWDADHGIAKWSPLADWSEAEVWAYLRSRKVPYNALHDQGFLSIGCAPCTRAVQPGEDPRAGRWWWEHPETKECGLHVADA
jgi:phosphoadenosine phosphosulfate reductase